AALPVENCRPLAVCQNSAPGARIRISSRPVSAIIRHNKQRTAGGGNMINLLRQRKFVYGTALAAGIFGLGVGQAMLQRQADAQGSSVQAPVFEVDPLWPKPLPNNWAAGWALGRRGGRAGSHLVLPPGGGGPQQQREGRRAEPAHRGLLPPRPAGPRL